MVFITSLIIGVILYTWGMDSFVYALMIAIVMEVANVFIFSRILRKVEHEYALSSEEYHKRFEDLENKMKIQQQCANCSHIAQPFKCKAFPDGIPKEIVLGYFDHKTKHPSQKNKLVFNLYVKTKEKEES